VAGLILWPALSTFTTRYIQSIMYIYPDGAWSSCDNLATAGATFTAPTAQLIEFDQNTLTDATVQD
jgi:hypothetical protein